MKKTVKQKKKINMKGILTQAYCTKENSHKLLDVVLLLVIKKILLKEIKKLPRYSHWLDSGFVEDNKNGDIIFLKDLYNLLGGDR